MRLRLQPQMTNGVTAYWLQHRLALPMLVAYLLKAFQRRLLVFVNLKNSQQLGDHQ